MATTRKATGKTQKKRSTKKSGSGASKKRAVRKSKTKSSQGTVSKVKRMAGKVFAGAAAGAAKGAVEVAEAGSQARRNRSSRQGQERR